LFAGDELRKDGGNGDQPRSLRRTHEANTGLRILESGWCGNHRRAAHADNDTLNPFLTFSLFTFNVPARDRSISI